MIELAVGIRGRGWRGDKHVWGSAKVVECGRDEFDLPQIRHRTGTDRGVERARGVLLYSSDGGIKWKRIALGMPLANIDFVSPTLGFAEAGGGIVWTENGGVTWRPAD